MCFEISVGAWKNGTDVAKKKNFVKDLQMAIVENFRTIVLLGKNKKSKGIDESLIRWNWYYFKLRILLFSTSVPFSKTLTHISYSFHNNQLAWTNSNYL